MRKVITLEQALNGKPDRRTAEDLRLLADQRRRRRGDHRAAGACRRIHGQAGPSARESRRRRIIVALDRKEDITTFPAVRGAAAQGVRDGRRSGRDDIQFAELHDCFTIAEIIAIEDLGFCGNGQGGPFAFDGCTLR